MSLLELALMCARLGLVSFGGGIVIITEMRREVVDVYHIMSDLDFSTAFSISQGTPGPTILYLIPVGYRADGVAGALVALAAFLVPTMLLVAVASRQWDRISHWPWVQAVNASVGPACVGLVLAGLLTVGAPLRGDAVGIALAVLAGVLIARFKVNPAFLVLGYGLLWVALPL